MSGVAVVREEVAAMVADGAGAALQGSPALDVDDWSLGPEATAVAVELIRRLAPRTILEFGSGASTIELGRAGQLLASPCRVVALEHDPCYATRTRCAVEAGGLDDVVDIVAAPLVARRQRGRVVPVYFLGESPDNSLGALFAGAPDLVLVDGPPKPLGGREGALLQAMSVAAAGTVILLDDSRRPNEQESLVRLLRLFDGHIEIQDLLGFDKGLALIIVTEPLPPDATPGEHEEGGTSSG